MFPHVGCNSTDIYAVAGAADVRAYYLQRAETRKLCLSPAEAAGRENLPVEDIVPPCAKAHLAEYEARSAQAGGPSGSCVVCLMQSPYAYNAKSSSAPPLLQGSLFYSVRRKRLFLPDELAILQGIPAAPAAMLHPELQRLDPWDGQSLVDVVGKGRARRLLGNGMDICQVGSALALMLMDALAV